MNINSVNNNYYSPAQSNDSNNLIKTLEKQKSQLTEQITSINQSKADAKTKKERISEIEQQIQQIDAQIQQIKMEEIKKKSEINTKDTQLNDASAQNGQNLSPINGLVEADKALSQAETVKSVKDNLVGQSNVLRMEIKLDAGRAGGETAGKTLKLAKVNERLGSIDISYAEKLKKAINAAKNHSDEKNDDKRVTTTEKTADKKISSDGSDQKNDKNEPVTGNVQQDNKAQNKSIDVLI